MDGARPDDRARYERHKERARQRQAGQARAGQDIGELPPVEDPQRKDRALKDLSFFLRTYFPESFPLPFSQDHLKAIAVTQQAIVDGGLFAQAMPRGSGKTTIAERAALWAVIAGHRQFVMLVGADKDAAVANLDSIRTELETNETLLADFPEVCFPIQKLEGSHQRAKQQRYRGQRTRMAFTQGQIVLPTIPGSLASGAILRVAGITGRIRGAKYQRPDGRPARPDMVLIDDPQTDDSARSPSQSVTRERIVTGAILGLAGPGQKISALALMTVICQGDMADSLLDNKKHPEWQGQRCKLVYAFPAAEKEWEEYARLRREGLAAGDGGRKATEYYAARRAVMDAGAVVAWAERHNADELSGLQYAMNLRIDNPHSFAAEYQNEPLVEAVEITILTAAEITQKLSFRARHELAAWAQKLTMHVDVHDRLLYYAVGQFGDRFRASIIDYGTWPRQNQSYFTLRDARSTLAQLAARARRAGTMVAGSKGAILLGLLQLYQEILGREYVREDGVKLKVSLCLVDEGYELETVHESIRMSEHKAVLMPSKGLGIKAADRPLSEYRNSPGDRMGHYWRIALEKGRVIRTAQFDANYWKRFIHERLATAAGDPSSLDLYGSDPAEHRLLADHLVSERARLDEGAGRKKIVFEQPPARPDNHFLDNVDGCFVGASIEGIRLEDGPVPKRQKYYKLSELQRKRRK